MREKTRKIRIPWRPLLVLTAFVAVGWAVGLLILGVTLLSALAEWRRTRLALRPFRACPRGHEVETYGVFKCSRCSAATESSAWFCVHCGSESGWTACGECGLAVANPRTAR